jgi:membrane peptidoglycan carboxypeptidase
VLLTGTVTAVLGALVLGAGLGAREASDRFLALPAALRPPVLPQRSVVLDAHGTPIGWFWEQDREVVPLARVAPALRQAVVDVEDSRFYDNTGVDLKGIVRAVVRDRAATLSGQDEAQQGASTITQQYVKNLRLLQARTATARERATGDTYARKLQEARYALWLARHTPKDDVLAGYLNLVYFGDGAYGVQAAAERFFGVDAARLTLPQAALLAGLVQSPSAYDPTRHPRAARERRDVVLDRMAELGHLTPAQHAAAVASPLGLHPGGPVRGCSGPTAYFCDSVRSLLLADPRLGADEDARRSALDTGGYRVRTTLDPQVQAAAVAATRRARGNRVALAAAVVQPGTGKLLALAASVPFGLGPGQTTVNLPLGGAGGYQAGSTFKVFVLAQALLDGVPLDLRLNAPKVFVASDHGKPYPVRNASDSESGDFTLEEATWHSVNTWYVQLQQRTGVSRPAALAEAMGVRRADGEPLQRVASFTLGTNEVTPVAMAEAYATLAARGTHCPAYALTGVRQAARVLPVTPPRCRAVLPPRVADTVTRVLTGVITHGTGRAADPGRPAAGKTGTVEDYSAAWFTGYTPELAAAVWMGDPRGGFRHPLRDVTVDGRTYPQVYGGGVPAQTWSALVRQALRGTPVHRFP